MENISSLTTFLIGMLVGWITNHWYAVNLREPLLIQSGGGGGSSFLGLDFHYSYVSIRNELRSLTIRLPETILFGIRLKTQFGSQVIERDPSSECRARLIDQTGKHISHLHWLIEGKVVDSVDIKSGKQANLLLFIRKQGEQKFYVYEPMSATDFSPKTTSVPTFSGSKSFRVSISYAHNKTLEFPAGVEIDFNGNYYSVTQNGSGWF